MVRFRNNFSVCCLATVGHARHGPSAASAELQPYKARYSVYRNGKLTGMTEVTAGAEARRTGSSGARPAGRMGWLASCARRDKEFVEGREIDGHFLACERFQRHLRVAGIDNIWTAALSTGMLGTVQIVNGKDELMMDLVDGAMDPLSLKLDMSHAPERRESRHAVLDGG